LPTDVWKAFADNADLINEEFAQVLANGRGVIGRTSNGAAESATSGRLVQSDFDAESDDGSKPVTADAVTSRAPAVSETEPPIVAAKPVEKRKRRRRMRPPTTLMAH
jgi:hypothetical protein